MVKQAAHSAPDRHDPTPDTLSTEQRILRAAREEFTERGIEGGRMQSIANRAGVNKALLHYYFRSKEKLYHAALREIAESFWGTLEKCLEPDAASRDIRTLIRTITTVFVRTMAANPDFPPMVMREIADGGKSVSLLAEGITERFGELSRSIFRSLNEEMERGTIRSVQPIHFFMNILGMCAMTFFVKPVALVMSSRLGMEAAYDDAFFDQRIEEIVSMACDGIFAGRRP